MLMEAHNIVHTYGNRSEKNIVLNNISLQIDRGETVGLLGKSGSGKTTLGQILCGILKPDSGELLFHGKQISCPFQGDARKKIQILFQHPESAFNPRLPLKNSIREIYKLYSREYSAEILEQWMKPFGIYRGHLDRFPAQLSGGELQRAALARILLAEPELIVLDEPTSMLDSISQAQIMHILDKLQKEKKVGYLFITHNSILCDAFSDRVYMIDKGIIEKQQNKGEEV